MEKDVSVLVEHFGPSPVMRIVDFLLENRLFDYSKKQIAEGAGVGRVTLFKHWGEVEKLGLVRESRKFGKTRLFKLDEKSPVVRKLVELELVLAEQAAKKVVGVKARIAALA